MMLRCSNCGLCLKRFKRYPVKDLPSELQNIIAKWLAPAQLSDNAVICPSCYTILNGSDIDQERRLGHTDVCIGCGISVLNLRNYILEPSTLMLNIFQWSINLPGHTNRVCQLCWMKGNRIIQKDALRSGVYIPILPEEPPTPVKQEAGLEPPPLDPTTDCKEIVEKETPTSIILPNYKRSPNTSRRCIYTKCDSASGHLVPTFVKVMLLKDFNFFIPKYARVCKMHLLSNTWHTLPEISKEISEFSVTQIEEIIALAKKEVSYDFDKVNEMPNHYCYYWTGLTVTEFLTLFSELSLDNFKPKPKSSLALYLIKLRTDDSYKRLASLFQISRTTLENRIKKMSEYIKKHSIPKHFICKVQRIKAQKTSHRNQLVTNTSFGSCNSSDNETIDQ
ncbi:uncharacterized protein LOC112047666 [Bicyclus anynana]|uniref:Uncharacterized protein LOC112047666 n=1 Tax=Bicyclus anynana TaxID=110368 RepID=A0A6J1NC57_BICAN|nr:uncharacterized protein LOC112047666 [Bicyclus anynana]